MSNKETINYIISTNYHHYWAIFLSDFCWKFFIESNKADLSDPTLSLLCNDFWLGLFNKDDGDVDSVGIHGGGAGGGGGGGGGGATGIGDTADVSKTGYMMF